MAIDVKVLVNSLTSGMVFCISARFFSNKYSGVRDCLRDPYFRQTIVKI